MMVFQIDIHQFLVIYLLKRKKNLKVINEKIDNNSNDNTSKTNIVFIGDSTIGTLVSQFRDEHGDSFNVINFASSGCILMLYHEQVKTNKKGGKFIDKRCDLDSNNKKFEKIKNLGKEKTIIVYGGSLPAVLSGEWFDNKEGGVVIDPYSKSIKTSFYFKNKVNAKKIEDSIIESLNLLADNSKLLIIVYPIPEVGFSPSDEMIKIFHYKTKKGSVSFFDKFGLTTSYNAYLNRIRESDKLYSKVKKSNVHKIYPEKVFCSKKI